MYLRLTIENSVFFNTCILSLKINHVHNLMENVEHSRDGKTKEAKTKGARERLT